ncbi:MraY family glycosyltransferase [Ferrovum sp. PN-J185]|uniref:MraY family glycosyltransferase n=1 Tax=Ferrovum sp. PN-J185 TaxID=1356306 RepID=UPI0007958208|nr:glycosyltransferase [Ferrovum sp. PN-J185]KXW55846.1 putative undecaprenyl-phosphate N-acetylglucosaminyl 1-phosphate transferase [Ferrovum sp. PN-J185]
MILLCVAFFASLLVAFVIIRYEYMHAHMTHDHDLTAIQKSHLHPVPRIGGLAIWLSVIVAVAVNYFFFAQNVQAELCLLIVSFPAFLFGLMEDVRHSMGVTWRLLASMLSGVLGVAMMHASINRVDVAAFDTVLALPVFAMAFSAFAVGGLTNAFNIIDGMNGLLAGIALIVLGAIAYLAHQLQDSALQLQSLIFMGSILGVMLFNYPRGLLFLGDGGAYFIGVMAAECLIQLINTHPDLSPWCALTLVIYPVTETLFSMLRRVLTRAHLGHPDRRHLHQLLFDSLQGRRSKEASELCNSSNSIVSPYLWVITVPPVMGALVYRTDTSALQVICSLFVLCYTLLYMLLKRYSLPAYLKISADE